MPKPARIEVYNAGSTSVELKCSETRDRVTVPPYSKRKVHASFLTDKPATIIETEKMERQEEAVQPSLQARKILKAPPFKAVDKDKKPENLTSKTSTEDKSEVVEGEKSAGN